MARVDLDYSGLNSGCLLNLKDTINLLNKTINYFSCFDIPYDFVKKNQLKELENKLIKIKKNLSDIENFIVNSNDNYNNLINNLETQANTLPSHSIKQRNNIV